MNKEALMLSVVYSKSYDKIFKKMTQKRCATSTARFFWGPALSVNRDEARPSIEEDSRLASFDDDVNT